MKKNDYFDFKYQIKKKDNIYDINILDSSQNFHTNYSSCFIEPFSIENNKETENEPTILDLITGARETKFQEKSGNPIKKSPRNLRFFDNFSEKLEIFIENTNKKLEFLEIRIEENHKNSKENFEILKNLMEDRLKKNEINLGKFVENKIGNLIEKNSNEGKFIEKKYEMLENSINKILKDNEKFMNEFFEGKILNDKKFSSFENEIKKIIDQQQEKSEISFKENKKMSEDFWENFNKLSKNVEVLFEISQENNKSLNEEKKNINNIEVDMFKFINFYKEVNENWRIVKENNEDILNLKLQNNKFSKIFNKFC